MGEVRFLVVYAIIKCLVKLQNVSGEKGPWNSKCCVPVSSTRMVRRGGSQTTAAWISQRWSGRTKMTLYVVYFVLLYIGCVFLKI